MLELYNFVQSTCSQMVRFCLAEKGLDWVDHRLDSRKSEHLTPAYLALNPNALVPTLVHEGSPIGDSTVIAEYLDEVFPEPTLSPATALGRAEMREWLRYFEEIPTPSIRYPSYNQYIRGGFKDLSDEAFAEQANKRPLRKHFIQRMTQKGFEQADIDRALENLQQSIDRVDAALAGNGGPWILGEQLTIADACFLPTIDRLDDLGYAKMWADRPGTAGWYDRIKARPAYTSTYYQGARLSQTFDKVA